VVELLLSEHDGDCQTCDRNADCELQALAAELGIARSATPGEKTRKRIDDSTPALVRDSGKCIKCRRCVTVCNETQGVGALFPQGRGFTTVIGPAFATTCRRGLRAVRPVRGGLPGRRHHRARPDREVWAALDDPDKHVIVQTAPAIRAALGECFGYEPGTLVTGKMVAALRRLGFDGVFDTNFAADLTIIEEGTELLMRLKAAWSTSSRRRPADVHELLAGLDQVHGALLPDMLPNLSTCKSPQQMFGAVAKTYYAAKLGKRPEDIVVVFVMPCTAKKFECQRPEMDAAARRTSTSCSPRASWAHDQAGRHRLRQPARRGDGRPLGLSTGAADIFANTGGVMEAALRTAYEIVTGRSSRSRTCTSPRSRASRASRRPR
jgi:NADP-reducing hydrogenase subunit HndD